jgi:hypothetical protein
VGLGNKKEEKKGKALKQDPSRRKETKSKASRGTWK